MHFLQTYHLSGKSVDLPFSSCRLPNMMVTNVPRNQIIKMLLASMYRKWFLNDQRVLELVLKRSHS